MAISAITTLIGKQAGALIAQKFGRAVVERWTRHRAQSFFDGFIEELANEFKDQSESLKVDQKIDAILNDEGCSEVLYDAYRTVCFSKSKTIGPRIIGFLTGKLILEKRMSDEKEDQIFKAAEELPDGELTDFFTFYRSRSAKASSSKSDKEPYFEYDSLVIPWSREHRDSAWPSDKEIDTSPLHMDEALGPWGSSLERLGFITSRKTHRRVEYKEDGERHVDQDGVLDIYSTTIIFGNSAKELADYFERALGAAGTPKV